MKTAFITGVTGQDGSYLAELLLEKGYEVHGLVRRQSTISTQRIDHLYCDPHTKGCRFFLHYGDLTDGSGLARLLSRISPDEIYNLGAQSHVRVSFDCPEYTVDVDATGTIRLLEAIRAAELEGVVKYYQASSSEMYGGQNCPPGGYNESHAFHPRSPYGCAKVFAFHQTVNYREAYGLHASNGILFNHESPRRGETFVTRKICRAINAIVRREQDKLFLGNLDAKRDWGHARDYVEAMWLMLQQPQPDDYVIATGETHSVREFLEEAFSHVMLDWREYVEFDPRYVRPAEVDVLLGDSSKARQKLGWKPEYSFKKLVAEMVGHECTLF
jgi:GDPmannose 4,6-dehydratase